MAITATIREDVRVVQEILGHSSAAITQNVYQHVAGELTADAMAALGQALGEE